MLLFLTSCGKNNDVNIKQPLSISYVKPPEWVTQETNDFLSAVGITNGKKSLIESKEFAEQNAIENLRINIIVGLESFLYEETKNLELNKRKKIISEFRKEAELKINEKFLYLVSRQDEMWQSPNTSALYVKMVTDGKQIAVKILEVIEQLQKQYDYDIEILACLLNIKNDMLYNNFVVNQDCDKFGIKSKQEATQINNITNKNKEEKEEKVNEDKNEKQQTIIKPVEETIKPVEELQKNEKIEIANTLQQQKDEQQSDENKQFEQNGKNYNNKIIQQNTVKIKSNVNSEQKNVKNGKKIIKKNNRQNMNKQQPKKKYKRKTSEELMNELKVPLKIAKEQKYKNNNKAEEYNDDEVDDED